MYALVDCNNFYVSCERVFQPQYDGKPVIVLSNNDGTAIARSEEAKALGITMADSIKFIQPLIQAHNIKVFSSNYTLYGDMCHRVQDILADYSANTEKFSIDESFLYFGNMPFCDLQRCAASIRERVLQWTGIPVSVGLAPTKTLAKLANRYAKKMVRSVGIHSLDTPAKLEAALRWCEVGDVCGIGPALTQKLQAIGVKTAYDFTQVNERWVEKEMTVVGRRLYEELRGIPAIKLIENRPTKQGICTSHQFGKLQTDKAEIKKAVATHATRCAYKLRLQNSCAGTVIVFLQTNQHRTQDKQFSHHVEINLINPTNSTNLIIYYAMKGVDMLYQRGINFHKSGVEVRKIVPRDQVQLGMWQQENREKNEKVMKALDTINLRMGRDAVRFAAQGYSTQWKLRSDYLSKRFTTRMEEIAHVR